MVTTVDGLLAGDTDRRLGTTLDALLTQLLDLNLAEEQPDGSVLLPWGRLHDALEDSDLGAARLLPIPQVADDIVPSLVSSGGVPGDDTFRVGVSGWHRRGAGEIAARLDFTGPVCAESPVGPFTLGRNAYRLLRAISAHAERTAAERNPRDNRLGFVEIRDSAELAGAHMDRMIRSTIIVRPKMLNLELERHHSENQVAVTVTPTFEGAPTGWVRAFDRSSRRVREFYSIPGEDGEDVNVVIDEPVQEVLQEIRRLPGRRVAGARARRLLENPVAFFGEAAEAVLDVEAIERSLARLRVVLWSLRAHVEIGGDRRVAHVDVVMEPLGEETTAGTVVRRITSPDGLSGFAAQLTSAADAGSPAVAWADRDIEVTPNVAQQAEELSRVADAWAAGEPVAVAAVTGGREASEPDAPRDEGVVRISADIVLDLSRYNDRVEAIGIETRFGIITIPLTEKGAWAPQEQERALLLHLAPADGAAPGDLAFTEAQLQDFIAAVKFANESGDGRVELPNGESLDTAVATAIVDALPARLRGATPEAARPVAETADRGERRERVGLLIKSNVDTDDYVTSREQRLSLPRGAVPVLPAALAGGVELKDHQREGVALLQHLYAESPDGCRGVILADDMGLGKTLQILTLIARAREDDPDLAPALIVAPVTLLENWTQEVARFFQPGSLPVATLYGPGLREHRASKGEIDSELLASGLTRFLRPGWHEDAAVVLTTYETLRDYEFSFGDIEWSIVACDEAQRIKNPNALVSRAAKKMKARFCIAATGTPVENNLTDLWSLFDFIQPGLFEPLNVFNRRYRRPIEAQGDPEAEERVANLRALIRPQLIRRTKTDVARDLPVKRFDEAAKTLRMSEAQRRLYGAALSAQDIAAALSGQGSAMLTLLAGLRRICTDPRVGEELDADYPPLPEYRARSPKMDWLIATLEEVRRLEEKALVFMERKDVQRLVQHYVREHFGFAPEIVNGESPTGAGADSRQRRVDRFQAAKGFNVLILSPVAAGVGLNIQGANHVIHYMRHWNPAKEDQATDRAYRIGQTRDVTVYTPIVCGDGWNSFDQRLDQLLERKRDLASDVLNGTDAVTEADFRDLFEAQVT